MNKTSDPIQEETLLKELDLIEDKTEKDFTLLSAKEYPKFLARVFLLLILS